MHTDPHDVVTPIEVRMGRSSGNIDPAEEYYIELTDGTSGAVIGKIRMDADNYATMLTSGGARARSALISRELYARVVGRYTAWAHVQLDKKWNGDDHDTRGELLAAYVQEERLASYLGAESLSTNLSRDGITLKITCHEDTASGAVERARLLRLRLEEYLVSRGWVTTGVASSGPRTVEDANRWHG